MIEKRLFSRRLERVPVVRSSATDILVVAKKY